MVRISSQLRSSVALLSSVLLVDSLTTYEGHEGPQSTQFEVQLRQGGRTIFPHVYGMLAPEADRQKHVNNFIEFEQDTDEVTTVVVRRLSTDYPMWPADTHIRPISYGINVAIGEYGTTATFEIKGNAKHLSIHYGSDLDNKKNSAIYSSMLIFVTPLKVAPHPTANMLVFKPGVHKLTDGGYTAGTGILTVNATNNPKVDAIIVERGAFVYGKIFVGKGYKVDVYGTGILCGEYFDFNQRKTGPWNQRQMMVNGARNIVGLTVVTPNFRLFDSIPDGGRLQFFRGIGWLPNNGQGRLKTGSKELDCFVRSYDDLVKADEGVTTARMVIWQGKNGASFQLGWSGKSIQKAINNYDWDIIGNEYETPTEWNGTETRSNNALFSSVRVSGAEFAGPYNFYNVNIDGHARNLFMLSLNSSGYLKNMNFHNLNVREGVENLSGLFTMDASARISDIHFHNFTIAGKLIQSLNDPALKFHAAGNVALETITFAPSVIAV